MAENLYQAGLIVKLNNRFPGCLILKNDSGYLQGIPDLTILYSHCWAMLEVKFSERAPVQPNQQWYIDWADDMSFGAFIYPENEEEVLDALQCAFEASGVSRLP